MKITVIVPTFNEQENIGLLIDGIKDNLQCNILVVDDGYDDTQKIALQCGAEVLQGQRKGLGQAIIDGINHATTDIVVVMDADLSHPPSYINKLLEPIINHGCDMTIGSRYVKGGDYSNWSKIRQLQSIIGVKIMQLFTGVKDSNSGFFAFRKSIIDGVKLEPNSWKIMLEVLFKGKWTWKKEVPITFNDRIGGVSKNSNRERIKHAKHLIKLLIWKFPKKYISFSIIGGIGSLAYFAIFWLITEKLHIWYGMSYFIATMYAIVQNYILNHIITFRKERKFNTNHVKGLAKYIGGSWLGESVEYGIMILLTEVFGVWYILSDFIGSGFSSIIKYIIFKKQIWSNKKTFNDAEYEWRSFFKGQIWQKISKQKIASVVKEYAGYSGITVDIGCGSSPLGVMVKHSDYIGIDTNKDKVDFMNGKQLKDARFTVGSVLDIPLEKETVDTVLFVETIEHLDCTEDIHKALSEIYRILKYNGSVIIAMPDFTSIGGRIMERLYKVFHPQAYADDHKMKLNTTELEKLCNQYGLTMKNMINLYNRDYIMKFVKY